MTYPVFAASDILLASDMNAVGLWKITDLTATFTGGTAGSVSNGTVTIGTGNSAIAVTSAFSADFDNYMILLSGGVGSTGQAVALQIGAATTGYYYSGHGWTYAGAAVNANGANTANFAFVGFSTTSNNSAQIWLDGPHNTTTTGLMANYVEHRTNGGGANIWGYLNNTTSYTGFTLSVAGTMTGGTIRVYGLRD